MGGTDKFSGLFAAASRLFKDERHTPAQDSGVRSGEEQAKKTNAPPPRGATDTEGHTHMDKHTPLGLIHAVTTQSIRG